ncbi:MAG: hypothetical protein CM15mP74_09110 [Halieaceae bacterium]|nr:MAG: hypothetical protein CM15mP74_09110 [Halieaceae bacterium]
MTVKARLGRDIDAEIFANEQGVFAGSQLSVEIGCDTRHSRTGTSCSATASIALTSVGEHLWCEFKLCRLCGR